ncbi:MAG: twin-arginine translocase TatA/TatE family subunit [Leptospirales bacterium]|nr:twin-arginine translocase TatA/TatE family subunit [Leptospirales bacterium]
MYDNITLNYAWMPGMMELVMIFLIILVLFGAKKVPSIAQDIGTGIRNFKKSLNGEIDEENKK